jgi:hypothetical protein
VHPAREECDNYDLHVAPVYDWPIIMISPSGLLVVASHVFAVSVLVLGAGLQKSK